MKCAPAPAVCSLQDSPQALVPTPQADPSVTDASGLNPLHIAAHTGGPRAAALLRPLLAALAQGEGGACAAAAARAAAGVQRVTPLHLLAAAQAEGGEEEGEARAAHGGWRAAAAALLEAGADPTAADSAGDTPLHVAARRWGAGLLRGCAGEGGGALAWAGQGAPRWRGGGVLDRPARSSELEEPWREGGARPGRDGGAPWIRTHPLHTLAVRTLQVPATLPPLRGRGNAGLAAALLACLPPAAATVAVSAVNGQGATPLALAAGPDVEAALRAAAGAERGQGLSAVGKGGRPEAD